MPPQSHKTRPTRPKAPSQHDHDPAEEDRQIEVLLANADEELASAVYTQAAETVITNLVKVLEAINKRQHRNYPVVKFAMVRMFASGACSRWAIHGYTSNASLPTGCGEGPP